MSNDMPDMLTQYFISLQTAYEFDNLDAFTNIIHKIISEVPKSIELENVARPFMVYLKDRMLNELYEHEAYIKSFMETIHYFMDIHSVVSILLSFMMKITKDLDMNMYPLRIPTYLRMLCYCSKAFDDSVLHQLDSQIQTYTHLPFELDIYANSLTYKRDFFRKNQIDIGRLVNYAFSHDVSGLAWLCAAHADWKMFGQIYSADWAIYRKILYGAVFNSKALVIQRFWRTYSLRKQRRWIATICKVNNQSPDTARMIYEIANKVLDKI